MNFKSSNAHPQISSLYNLYLLETQPFRKVHRMIDLFETIIKMHTVVILAEYFNYNKLSDSAKGLLSQGLRTPSLGTWQLFSRVLFEELQKENISWFLEQFKNAFILLDKSLNNSQTNVIAFRNSYAHGATPSDEKCIEDLKLYEPFLNQLLKEAWLENSATIVHNGIVFLKSESRELTLHPILLYRDEINEASIAFFNDLKNDTIGLLNYPLGKHYREKEFFQEFNNLIPLNEWKKSGSNDFQQRIDELTETFKGRMVEREMLLHFVSNNNKGYLSVQGNPGIGKSALIAQFFKDLKAHESLKNIKVVEYFIRRGTQQAKIEYLLEYLINKTDELFPKAKKIKAEGKMVFDIQNQLFSKWRLWAENNNGTTLLFLIDGLDEGVENNLISYLPRENFQNILIIYGSRPGGHKSIDELWGSLPVENHLKLELRGLGKDDIRAMIYEVANKYELERESSWIDAVQARSQGNPLYLKLLCDAIANNTIGINDINALPKEIDEYYRAILHRYAQDNIDGDALLASLYTFAAAKDYLTMTHLGLINNLGEAKLQRISSTLKEVLFENPLTENVLDYQLFHESFREYLFREKAFKTNEAKEQIINFCGTWKELDGSWEQRYTLEHYASHLSESNKATNHETLLKLIYNNEYTNTQKKVLRHFNASNRLMQLALLKSGEVKNPETMLEAAMCLVDLKYEEAYDAPRIIEMVANNEMELAIQRIESFGGNDKEGLQQKFILYMLCLMELTMLESKNKQFRKEAIEKLLKHLDENLPVDHSVLNWNDFFSNYLVFQMASELMELDLDYFLLYKRTGTLDNNWLSENGPYNDKQFDLLYQSVLYLNHNYDKSIFYHCDRSEALICVIIEQVKQGKQEEALKYVESISDKSEKSKAKATISSIFANHGELEKSTLAMEEAITCVESISDKSNKSRALAAISIQLANQGKLEEAYKFAWIISEEFDKSEALASISTLLANQGMLENAASAMQAAINSASVIIFDYDKDCAIKNISTELTKQGNQEEAFKFARTISHELTKNKALAAISTILANQGKKEEAVSLMQEAITSARGNHSNILKRHAIKDISTELAKQGKLVDALTCIENISNDCFKKEALMAISIILAKQGKLKDTSSVMQEALACGRGINNFSVKDVMLKDISTELAKQGMLEKALACEGGIDHDGEKSELLSAISKKLAKKGMAEEALKCVGSIMDKFDKSISLAYISTILANQGKLEEAESAIQEAIICSGIIRPVRSKSIAQATISTELAKQGELFKALECVESIIDESEKSKAQATISTILANQGKVEEAEFAMQKAIKFALSINNISDKSKAISGISTELTKQRKLEEAIKWSKNISDEFEKSKALAIISTLLANQGMVVEARNCARSIINEFEKSNLLATISTIMDKQGKVREAESAIQESLSCAMGINNAEYELKSMTMQKISSELAKQEKLEEAKYPMQIAIECAKGISDNFWISAQMSRISIELATQDNYHLAEKIGLEISQIATRFECWKSISKNNLEQLGWQKALEIVNQWKNGEARFNYLKGLAENIHVHDSNLENLVEFLPLIMNDTNIIEALLRAYGLNEIFFNQPNGKLINRLNRSLNLQWAIDIASKFEKEFERSSQNVPEWINEIEDENDREDVLSWAEKVKQGKMTEEKFLERINKL